MRRIPGAAALALLLLLVPAAPAAPALGEVRLGGGFTLACSPSAYTLAFGGGANGNCTVTPSGTGTAWVVLDCDGAPSGFGCGFFPNPVFASGGPATAAFALAHSGTSPPPGTYAFDVRGQSAFGGAPQLFPITVTVTAAPGDFSVSCNPSSYTIPQGGSANGNCTVSSTAPFSSPVTLDCAGQPSGVGCSFSPNPITPPSGGSASSTLTLSVGSGVAPGTYSFNVRGTSGSATRTFGITLTVTGGGGSGDFSVACSPSSYTIPQGGSASGTCTVTSTAPFSSPVTLDCTGQPSGVGCSFSPNPITPPSGSSASSFLTLTVGATPAGTYTFQVRGTSGSLQRTTNVTLTVTGPGGGGDFSVSCNPSFFTAPANSTRTSTCTVQSTAPFSSPVTLSCTVPDPHLSCAFAPNPITPPSGGSASSTLTLTIAPGTSPGAYFFIVNGTSGGQQRFAQMVLFVT